MIAEPSSDERARLNPIAVPERSDRTRILAANTGELSIAPSNVRMTSSRRRAPAPLSALRRKRGDAARHGGATMISPGWVTTETSA